MLFDLVRGQIWPKMHIAPGNRNLLPFWAVFGLKTPHGGGRSSVQNGYNSGKPRQNARYFGSSNPEFHALRFSLRTNPAKNARSPGKLQFIAVLGRFPLENSARQWPVRASKMAITRASRVKTRGTSAHRIRNFMLFDLVRGQIWPKMQVAPGNRDLLPFWGVFGLKTPPGSGRSGRPKCP